MQAEAMLPVATHLIKTCEDLSMNESKKHISLLAIYTTTRSGSYIVGDSYILYPYSLRTAACLVLTFNASCAANNCMSNMYIGLPISVYAACHS